MRSAKTASAEVAPRGIGVDTGGTFTDFVALTSRGLVALKIPSTPRAPERAVVQGLRRLRAGPATAVRHGSTVATNTLLERAGARVVLLTTQGFEDLLEIGRQDRPDLYALAPARPPPLVPPARRIGVPERCGPRGARWLPLTAAAVRRAVRAVRGCRPEVVAVGLLHAYAHGGHERRLGRALRALGLPVTLSSELCPEFREYERLSTTVTNAYLGPRVAGYLTRLARGAAARIEVVQSHGGTVGVVEAAREPVRQLLSGPAAGLAAARDVALGCGYLRALTLDVGGTSTDCAYLDGGELPRRRAREVAGLPVLLPLLDVHTVGAGGGSIARQTRAGLLAVGPESAGADPGPASYGRGGPAALTDALVVLGRLPDGPLAGGSLTLDRAAAGRAIGALARRLGLGGPVEAALGVTRLAEAHIEAALRKVSVERGHDPRGAALVAFGGAGGLHACAVAESLGCRIVLFPRHAGLLSAIGALTGGARREQSRSVLLDAGEVARRERVWRRLERRVRASFPRAVRMRVRLERWAELRYAGQSHELAVSGGAGLTERFHREHLRRYGFAERGRDVEVVTLEVRGRLPGERIDTTQLGRRSAPPIGRHRVREPHGWVVATAWEREGLGSGFRARGPALVMEAGATLWIPPGWRASMHPTGTLVVVRERRG
ncbi:MAG TPA: hydantoinase/oxoprolinase family protein [Candidatus Eisenbacteria bacterium]